MPALDRTLSAPSAQMLRCLCAAVAPGSRPGRPRRLPGGMSGITHAVDLVAPPGDRRRLVIRRYRDDSLARWPEAPARLWRTLVALEQLGVNAPRPVFFDPDGAVFGDPALVMTREPGRGLLCPRDLADWCRQLAEALVAIHRSPVEGVDLDFLPGPDGGWGLTPLERFEKQIERLEDSAAIRAALERMRPPVETLTPALIHGDYWAGNTLWRRGRLMAVVDWEQANLDYPGLDIGYCRMDLAMMIGPPAPDLFLRAYEAACGGPVVHVPFWDLLGALRVPPDPGEWLPGYHGLGRTDLTAELLRVRLRDFTRAARAAS